MASNGKIFISYRRDDAAADARLIYERLRASFGKGNVFIDVDNMRAGQRFERELDKALAACDVLIIVIGSRWMDLLREYARLQRRDFVREEIAAALARDITLIPVLVGRDSNMPELPPANALPDDIREMVSFQKHSMRHERIGPDSAELVESIKEAIAHKHPSRRLRTFVIAAAFVGCMLGSGILLSINSDHHWFGWKGPISHYGGATDLGRGAVADKDKSQETATPTPKPIAPLSSKESPVLFKFVEYNGPAISTAFNKLSDTYPSGKWVDDKNGRDRYFYYKGTLLDRPADIFIYGKPNTPMITRFVFSLSNNYVETLDPDLSNPRRVGSRSEVDRLCGSFFNQVRNELKQNVGPIIDRPIETTESIDVPDYGGLCKLYPTAYSCDNSGSKTTTKAIYKSTKLAVITATRIERQQYVSKPAGKYTNNSEGSCQVMLEVTDLS